MDKMIYPYITIPKKRADKFGSGSLVKRLSKSWFVGRLLAAKFAAVAKQGIGFIVKFITESFLKSPFIVILEKTPLAICINSL